MARWRTKTKTLKNGTKVTRATPLLKEWVLQAAAVRALKALPEFGKRFALAADMAAHKRSPKDATIAKATGLTPGEHDLRIYLEGGRLALIEYKAGKGAVRKVQRDRHALLHGLGFTLQAVVKTTTEEECASETVSIVLGWLAANDNGWRCPIGQTGCDRNCGGYGCGN